MATMCNQVNALAKNAGLPNKGASADPMALDTGRHGLAGIIADSRSCVATMTMMRM